MKIAYYFENHDAGRAVDLLEYIKKIEFPVEATNGVLDFKYYDKQIKLDEKHWPEEVVYLWASASAPIIKSADYYTTVEYLLDQDFQHYYEEVISFIDSCLSCIEVKPITPPVTIDFSELPKIESTGILASGSPVLFSPRKWDFCTVISLLPGKKKDGETIPILLTTDQEVQLLASLVKSGLVDWNQLQVYSYSDSADGSHCVKSVSELLRLLKGIGSHKAAWGDGIYDYQSVIIQSVFQLFSQNIVKESAPIIADIVVSTNSKGIGIHLYSIEEPFNDYFLKDVLPKSELGVFLEKIMKNVTDTLLWRIDELRTYEEIIFLDSGEEQYSYEEIYQGDHFGKPISEYKLGAHAKVLFAVLLLDGIVEERPIPGSNNVERFITPKGLRFGYNFKNESGGNTTYWYKDKIEELKRLHLTDENIADVKFRIKNGTIGKITRQLQPISKLLNDNGVKLSAVKANKRLLEVGILEQRKRISRYAGELREYRILTSLGLRYGENRASDYSGATTPYYYSDMFEELVAKYLSQH